MVAQRFDDGLVGFAFVRRFPHPNLIMGSVFAEHLYFLRFRMGFYGDLRHFNILPPSGTNPLQAPCPKRFYGF